MNLTPETIRSRLKSAAPDQLSTLTTAAIASPENGLYPAAVLMPLFQDQGEWQMVFIKRSEHDADRHSSQIAFPGGRAEMGDRHLLDTALREAREEIALQPEDVHLLGQVDMITTVSDYRVTPFVGLIPWPYPLQPDQREVEKVLTIPLGWLADPDHSRTELWGSPESGQRPHPVIFFDPYQDEILWGASARMVCNFLQLLEIGA
jgi:8-oxo-dGTP pyrophosphatase MutT (NUDIX family)